ncbi:MAG: AmmeMemoRadiSam system protein B [Candidatus Zixiibacteriota bacterium]|nr:MAG: AmmeMemoRadiSam system protein B [candidate division Zixibacteria bacterium]
MKRLFPISAIVLLLVLCFAGANGETRKPAVAGTFYPGDSTRLTQVVRDYLRKVKDLPEVDGQLMALIVPHAGLVYSGQIAAYSYKLLEGSDVKTVVLCGPAHRIGFQGASVYGPDITWQTPLGEIPCDKEVCQQMVASHENISVLPEPHAPEHCLEVQLPFLQMILRDFEIVPLLIGYPDQEVVENVADAMAGIDIGKDAILVASTDWQHYRPASEGWKYDSVGVDCIRRLNPDDLESYLKQGKTEACGGIATVAVMRAAIAKGADKVKILKYGDSGDASGDKATVVGYLAAAIYKSGDVDTVKSSEKEPREEQSTDYELTAADRETLLKIARTSIDCHLNKKPLPSFETSDILRDNGAAFVTLTKQGRLRGCIGYTTAFMPLHKAVSECAIKAAVQDYRFPPVIASELPGLHIEISVLTPLQQVESLDEIKVGRDGLMITLGAQRGLLLPQVATSYGWSETEFLQQTCRKAGLPFDAYLSPDALIERFQAVIFGEGE